MILINKALEYPTQFASNKDIYLFTANSTIKRNGCLVMGAGAALHVRETYPGSDRIFGARIKHLSIYGLVISVVAGIGAFQTKKHFAFDSTVDIIKFSVERLTECALANPGVTFHLNYPGINNGKLTVEVVQPLIDILPDNVLIYKI